MLPDELPPEALTHAIQLALRAQDRFAERVEQLGDDPLRAYLRHVVEQIPYYRALVPTHGLERLDQFPIVDRATMHAGRDAFLAPDFLEEGKLLFGRTNGTLSVPLAVSCDLPTFFDVTYFVYARIAVTEPGLVERFRGGEVGICVLTDLAAMPRSTLMVPPLEGALLRRLPVSRGPEADRETCLYLRQAQPLILCGKPNVLIRFGELDRDEPGGPRIRPALVISSSTALYPSDRAQLEALFACRVADAYTTTEAGLVAVGCRLGTGMHVEADRVCVEVERSDGSVGPDGRGELILTGISNWAQAIVRYRIGDRGAIALGECACGASGATLIELPTRDLASYDVPGVGTVTTAALDAILAAAPLRQFEVSQSDGGDLLVRIVPRADQAADEVRRILRPLLGEHFHVESAAHITLPGGKALRFVKQPLDRRYAFDPRARP